MKKIPTLFDRDWNGDRSRVVNAINPDAAWVFAGEGIATRKIDGTCCMVFGNKLFKRRELRASDPVPEEFRLADRDNETGKIVGWMPVTDASEDRYHREAWTGADHWPDGTYELIGPKVQGNPEHSRFHLLISHQGSKGHRGDLVAEIPDAPRTFDGLAAWLVGKDIEGIVWHHPDGRMAKIKLRDFGLSRTPTPIPHQQNTTQEKT